jgi:serine protease inhibitor ecotin
MKISPTTGSASPKTPAMIFTDMWLESLEAGMLEGWHYRSFVFSQLNQPIN